ncbi:PEBP-like protein [Cryphonectria parasitica EP155]|uniref:PEBP-like protein n=1 Tax=Cryphonectria parasitica (strain ATCC 38755 / EP155) TaxID=660469 RepID=A0A9P5CMT9_CRYP1|nr:PEBP-like protein [Cryphonectria parasitica EP155]KAF3763607.1 PEBP-like protein [Cryphonectria parasitica EP155]
MPANEQVEAAFALIKQDPSNILGLKVGKHNITEPGQYVPRADAKEAPEITYPAASPSKSYTVICLDLDPPSRSFSFLGPALHWIQPGLRVGSSSAEPLASSEPFIANYLPPGPPPGVAPHRYVFYLYEEPEGSALDGGKFAPKDGKPMGIMSRVRTSLDDWVVKMGLGPLVAANYFNSN